MKTVEFKTVHYEPGLGKRLTGDDFGESFMKVLTEHGQQGWDLKSVIREHGLQTLLVFSREVPDSATK